ncbi:MAG: glycosyltransferase family 4 protein [Ignavibacterium sp.]
MKDKSGIIWTDASYYGFKLAELLKKHQPNSCLFLELSEFLDIHRYNKGNFLQRIQGDKRMHYFEKIAYYKYDGLALISRALFNYFTNFPEPRPKLLHLPMTVDLTRFAGQMMPLAGFEQPYIVFVGVMNDAKDGVSILIKAFAKIAPEFPKLKLYLIGGWNYDTPIHLKLIREYRLEHKIFWKGEMHRDHIPAIIKNANLLALPRPDSKQAQGGFPTKLGEYLATGNPVCATTVGEIPDYLIDGESVYFAEPGSVDSFAEAMRRALSNPEEAKRIGANGRKVAETHFNKDIQAKRLYEFLMSLKQNTGESMHS